MHHQPRGCRNPRGGDTPGVSAWNYAEGMSTRSRWVVALIAVAALILIYFAFFRSDSPDSAADPSATESSAGQTEEPSTEPTEPPTTDAVVPVYYVGDTPQGPRLYREFHVGTTDALSSAVNLAVSEQPLDPDYSTPWAKTVSASASYDDDVITVDLSDSNGTPLQDPFAGMSPKQAELALQQLIYTAQGALGEGRVPVQFLIDGQATDTVLGLPTSEPLDNAPVLDTLSLVNVTTPAEGDLVGGDLVVDGLSNSFEANVIVRLEPAAGGDPVFEEGITADGWMGDELFPFAHTFDISAVPPGTYVLTAMTDDPSGGEEGFGPFTDTKTITVG